jgi:hypothetical protein
MGLAGMFANDLPEDEMGFTFGPSRRSRSRNGLTNCCRRVLLDVNESLGVQDMLARVQQKNPRLLQHHKDPAASITTILNRLVQYGEAKVTFEGNRRTWMSTGEDAGT